MFSPLQKILGKAAQKYNFTRQFEAIQICQEYRNIAEQFLPPGALTHTYPKSYEDKTLTIGIYNSIWAEQITMQKHHLQEAINQKFGPDTVKKIKTSLMEPKNVMDVD